MARFYRAGPFSPFAPSISPFSTRFTPLLTFFAPGERLYFCDSSRKAMGRRRHITAFRRRVIAVTPLHRLPKGESWESQGISQIPQIPSHETKASFRHLKILQDKPCDFVWARPRVRGARKARKARLLREQKVSPH